MPLEKLFTSNSGGLVDYWTFVVCLLSFVFLLVYVLRKRICNVSIKAQLSLIKLALGYCSITSFFFVSSINIHPILKLAGLAALSAGIQHAYSGLKEDGGIAEKPYKIRISYLIFTIGLLAVAYSSMFWSNSFMWDWEKHRSVLLSLHSNPIQPKLEYFGLTLDGQYAENPMAYYYGMYLPAALSTKAVGYLTGALGLAELSWTLSILFFGWCMAGMVLSLLLAPLAASRIFRKTSGDKAYGFFYLTIIVFSGLNWWVGAYESESIYIGHAEWVTPYPAQLSSFISSWQWTPQHLIASLLGVVLLLVYCDRYLLFPLTLWSGFLLSASVFSFIGLLPLMVMLSWKRIKSVGIREIISFMSICVVLFLFYFNLVYPPRFGLNSILNNPLWVLAYAAFLSLEVTPFLFVLLVPSEIRGRTPKIVWVSLGFIAFVTLFESSGANDLVMRSTIPSLTVLMLYSAQVTHLLKGKPIIYLGPLAVYMLLATPCFINEYVTGLRSAVSIERSFTETEGFRVVRVLYDEHLTVEYHNVIRNYVGCKVSDTGGRCSGFFNVLHQYIN